MDKTSKPPLITPPRNGNGHHSEDPHLTEKLQELEARRQDGQQLIDEAFEPVMERDAIQRETDVPDSGYHGHAKIKPAENRQSNPFNPPAHWKRLDVAQVRAWDCKPLHPIVEGIIARTNFIFVAAQSQTGKTLFFLWLGRKLLHDGTLLGKYSIAPVRRVLYFLLEDPDRRAQDRILDVEDEFPKLDPDRFIIYVAPGFKLTDLRMLQWLKETIGPDAADTVVILDTYQKATPGISSFDDEKQSEILHSLSNLTRELNTTLIVVDHIRKESNGHSKGKSRELTIDDLKGSGGKVANADCVILMQRTPDRKQIKFYSRSKDFDSDVRVLLNVSPRGSKEPKFSYAGDLEQMGARSHGTAEARRKKVLEAMAPDIWMSIDEIAKACHVNETGKKTLQRDLAAMTGTELDSAGEKKARRYCRNVESIGQDA